MFRFYLAGVVVFGLSALGFFRSEPWSDGLREAPSLASSGAPEVVHPDQSVFFQVSIEYHLFHGEWDASEVHGAQRMQPAGAEGHFLELGRAGREAEMVAVPVEGEVYLIADSIIVVDFVGRGNVELRSLSFPEPLLADPCDGVYSGVGSVDFTGGCWLPLVADPETGVWSKVCGKNNSKKCEATINFTDGRPDKELAFKCSATGEDQGSMTGNNATGSAFAFNADGGC